jgi:hypothetical protein
MNPTLEQLFALAESMIDAGRPMLSVETFDQARQLASDPGIQALASHNLGVTYWHSLGDGEAALREFQATAALFDEHDRGQFPEPCRALQAGALEGAMLCSSSFEEFEGYAERLSAVTPEAPIVTRLRREVIEAHEQGERWSERMFALAHTYHNRADPSRDPGRYGEAKATYQLLVLHRRELRLSREIWRSAVEESCALSLRMATDCMTKRGGDDDPNPPEEFLPILTSCLPLVDDYLTGNPGDSELEDTRARVTEVAGHCHQRWEARIGRRAARLQEQGDLQGAMALLKDQERGLRERTDMEGLADSLSNQSALLMMQRDFDGAIAQLKEVDRICREIGYLDGLQLSLEHQSVIHRMRGNLDDAAALLEEQEQVCRQLDDPRSLATCLANRAALIGLSMGRPRDALPLAEEAYELASRHGMETRKLEPLLERLRRGE